MTKHTLAALAFAAGTAFAFTPLAAHADPTLGIQLAETGYATFTQTSSTNPLVVSQGFGTFSSNVEVNQVVTNPLSIDLGSSNVSTSSAGTLTVTASVSGLTSPTAANGFISQFSGNFGGAVSGLTLATYYDNSNALFGTGTLLSTLTSDGSTSPFGLSDFAMGTLTAPFALTEVMTITTTGAAHLSLDGSTAVPEPGSLALLGTGLLALGLAGWSTKQRYVA